MLDQTDKESTDSGAAWVARVIIVFLFITVPATVIDWLLSKTLGVADVLLDDEKTDRLMRKVMTTGLMAFSAVGVGIVADWLGLLSKIGNAVLWCSMRAMTFLYGLIEAPDGVVKDEGVALRWESTTPPPDDLPDRSQTAVLFGVIIAAFIIFFAAVTIINRIRAAKIRHSTLQSQASHLLAEHDDLIEQWRRYTHDDIELVARYGLLSDITQPLMATHLDALDEARRLRPSGAVTDSELADYREAVRDLYYSWNNALVEVGARDDTKVDILPRLKAGDSC